jgi:hypothetical protein
MLAQRVGDAGLHAFAQIHARTTRSAAAPAREAGDAGGARAEPAAYHKAMFERLVGIERLPEGALPELAARRADAIIEALVEAGAERARVASGNVNEVEARDGTVPVELGLEPSRSAAGVEQLPDSAASPATSPRRLGRATNELVIRRRDGP